MSNEKKNATKILLKKSFSTVSPELIFEKKEQLDMENSTPLSVKFEKKKTPPRHDT